MTNIQRYTTAINRLTVIAAKLDYNRIVNRIPEHRYNKAIVKTYKAIDQLHDLLKCMPVLIYVYGENEICRGDILALL